MRYDILKSFRGSQDGTKTEMFEAGTQRDLSPYLASCIDPSWARPASESLENKAIITEGKPGRPRKVKAQ